MSKVEDQLKLLAQETDVEENDEVENPWIDAESKLSDDEKLEKLKDLARYANSNEFKSLRRKYKDLLQLVKEEIRKKAYARTETKAEKSVLDEYVVIANTIREIAEDVTNLTFKDYLLKGRVESYDSAIINKKGNVIR